MGLFCFAPSNLKQAMRRLQTIDYKMRTLAYLYIQDRLEGLYNE